MGVSQEKSTLAEEIIQYANSAHIAQQTLSTQSDPMIIKQFRFLVKYSFSETFKVGSEIGFSYWRVSGKASLAYETKSDVGLEVECTIVPVIVFNTTTNQAGSS